MRLAEAVDQEDLQPLALYPFEGGAVSPLPDILDECTATRMHDLAEGILSLLANGNIFFDVDVSLRL